MGTKIMTVLPGMQPRDTGSADPETGCVEIRWRVLERQPDNRCVAFDLVVTADFDGTITVAYTGNQCDQQAMNLTSITFDRVEPQDGRTVLTWTNGETRPVLRLLSQDAGDVTACRSDIPERLGLTAGTYDLQETRFVPSASSID